MRSAWMQGARRSPLKWPEGTWWCWFKLPQGLLMGHFLSRIDDAKNKTVLVSGNRGESPGRGRHLWSRAS